MSKSVNKTPIETIALQGFFATTGRDSSALAGAGILGSSGPPGGLATATVRLQYRQTVAASRMGSAQ